MPGSSDQQGLALCHSPPAFQADSNTSRSTRGIFNQGNEAAVQKSEFFARALMKQQSFVCQWVPNTLLIEAINPHPNPKNNIGLVLN